MENSAISYMNLLAENELVEPGSEYVADTISNISLTHFLTLKVASSCMLLSTAKSAIRIGRDDDC